MSAALEDPVVATSRRESLLVMLIFVCALTYTLTYCYIRGYDRPPETLTFVFGFPDWVFWGILLPWSICVAISFWFGRTFMRDADLGRTDLQEEEID